MTDALKAELRDRIASGDVLVVVGTGVSLAATTTAEHPRGHALASWKGLVTNGIERCVELGLRDAKWGDTQKGLLHDGDIDDLLGAADQVQRRLQSRGMADWRDWLRATVGTLRATAPALIEAIRDLRLPVATLNYDDLLLPVLPQARLYTWQEAESWPRVLKDKDAILHLHGHWDKPASVVLGIRAYDAVHRHALAQHLQRVVVTTHNLLFIGCGSTFEDPNLKPLLDWMAETLKDVGGRHYLLTTEGNKEEIERRLPPTARVWVLSHGKEHSDLLNYLRSLAPKPIRNDAAGGDKPQELGAHTTHNLPPPNHAFVGRTDELEALRKALTASGRAAITQPQAITGLGGIGKTSLALAYCYRHLADYRLIWWLRAEEPTTLAADLAALAEPLGLDPTIADQAKLLGDVRARLEATPDWLLVLDNAPDATVRAHLPRAGRGHVLLTSRWQHWDGTAGAVELEVLPPDDAVRLLVGDPAATAAARPDAAPLAETLGCLPLALAQARAYMQRLKVDITGYRRKLAENRAKVLAWRPKDAAYPLPVAETWQASIDAAAKECIGARPLLELLAFMAPEPLPRAVLSAEPAALPESLRDDALDDAIGALDSLSLIDATPDAIEVHRLVQTVTRAQVEDSAAASLIEAAARLVRAAMPFNSDYPSEWSTVRALLPHATTVAYTAEGTGVALRPAVGLLNLAGIYHRARGSYGEAEPLLVRAIAITERALGPEHPELAIDLNNLAALYRSTGRFAEAEPLYWRAIAIGEKTLGPDHPHLATWLNNLALLYETTGRYAEAEPLFERAVAIGEKTLGPDHPDLANWLNNFANLYQSTGRYAEAEPLFERAIDIGEKRLEPDHPDLAHWLNNLANLYQSTGRYAEAEPLYGRAIDIGEKSIGPEHPDLATRLNNLANLYQSTGRHAEAEPLYQRAVAVGERKLGSEHPELANWLNNLASLYQSTGRYAEAEALYERAIAVGEKTLGPEHPTVAAWLNNLAGLHEATGRHAEAESFYQRAIAIDEKALGPDHPDLATSLANLALFYKSTDRCAEAEPLYRRALTIFGRSLSANHPHLAAVRDTYAGLLHQLGRKDDAAKLRQEAKPSAPAGTINGR